MFNLSRFKSPLDVIVDFQFGAYYSIQSRKGYEIIRLLDLPGDSYHCQIISWELSTIPSIEQVKDMKPVILHVPMDLANLLGKEVKRLGHSPLTAKDLYGYSVYFEEMGVDDEAVKEHFEQLIRLSKEAPQRMRLYKDADSVVADYL